MTTHLVISDIHRDIKTLQMLLDKYQKQFDDIWFLGDIAGHGEHLNGSASAVECYQLLYGYELKNQLSRVIGNWEKWVTLPPIHYLENNPKLYAHIMQAQQEIANHDFMDWINKWDWIIEKDDFTLTHGWTEKLLYQSESDPWEAYLEERDSGQVTKVFLSDRIYTRHVLVGHTHNPGFFRYNGRSTVWVDLSPEMIGIEQSYNRPDLRFVLNPGSLSGARDKKHNGLKTVLFINTEEKSFRYISL